MLRKDVIKECRTTVSRMEVTIQESDGTRYYANSNEITRLEYIAYRLYTPCNLKTVISLNDGCRMLIDNRAFGKTCEDGSIGQVEIRIADPLFGEIINQRYYLTEEDVEKYNAIAD